MKMDKISKPESPEFFQKFYQDRAPWDTGEPQPVFKQALEQGVLVPPVLDVGCGSGVLANYLALNGLEVQGIDFAPNAIEQAELEARQMNSPACFQVADAFDAAALGRRFRTVVDQGFFHTLSEGQHEKFVAVLEQILLLGGKYLVLGLVVKLASPNAPNPLSVEMFHRLFGSRWSILKLEPTQIANRWSKKGFPGLFAVLEFTGPLETADPSAG